MIGFLNFRLVSAGRENNNNKQTKGNNMIMTLTVFKEVHNTWLAKNGKDSWHHNRDRCGSSDAQREQRKCCQNRRHYQRS